MSNSRIIDTLASGSLLSVSGPCCRINNYCIMGYSSSIKVYCMEMCTCALVAVIVGTLVNETVYK